MVKIVSGCVQCGQKPCYHCKATEYWCDECEKESNKLYEWGDQQMCYDCIIDYIKENPDEIFDLLEVREVEE